MKNQTTKDRPQRILDTALLLFYNSGYFNTSVHDIQHAADVSIGSIYHHFGNKQGIARALYHHLADQMTEAVFQIMAENAGLYRQGRAFLDYLFAMAETAPAAMHYILCARHQEFMPGEKSICSSKPFERIQQRIRQAMDQGEIRKLDPAIASAALFGGAIRLIHLRLDGVLDRPLSDCAAETWQCAWRCVALQ
ncbi:MAG: TetR/AcrR family transcriptional regulator [Desulfobacterales bacterium]|nr:TetR/AcrR family transcriptional regulator [Desulfobacterales bacterium]